MTPKEIQKYRRLAKLTGEKCGSCPSLQGYQGEQETKYRCCDKSFCNIVKINLPNDVYYNEPNLGNIPFMGPNGCIVEPHHRPYCTGYICASNLEDQEFADKYKKLCKAVGLPVIDKFKSIENINQKILELLQ